MALLNILIREKFGSSNHLSPLPHNRTLLTDDDMESRAMVEMEKLCQALQTKDESEVKALFSKNALAEIEDFEAGVDSVFEFYNGNLE